jgi:SH3 domain-containing protein
VRCASEVSLTADQYSQIAQGYEEAASDPLVAPNNRADLAKKAEWFRFLARREQARQGSGRGQGDASASGLKAEPKFQARSWLAMAPFLTTLWITGAAVYLIGTVLFTNAVNLSGIQEPKKVAPEIMQPLESVPIASVQRNETAKEGNPRSPSATDSPHAISPDQPPYESPGLTVPSSPLSKEEAANLASSQPVQRVEDAASAEVLIVTVRANIHNGPSNSSRKIGTATAGGKIRVKARKGEWVQFVDPSSGNTGWIQSSLLAEASEGEGIAPYQRAEAPPLRTAKSKLANKKPSAPPVSPRPKAYADLPADEEFLPLRKRGAGLLNRRRMLREGLMSPDFFPPD